MPVARPLVITLTGPESTGKSTLADRLARRFAAPVSAEGARHYVDAAVVGRAWGDLTVRHVDGLEADVHELAPDIAVLAIPADDAQRLVDRVVAVGIKAIMSFVPAQLQVPADVSLKTVNMAMELEGLSYALSHRE